VCCGEVLVDVTSVYLRELGEAFTPEDMRTFSPRFAFSRRKGI
jgi:hypothetical protein